MANQIFLYLGSCFLLLWGVAHLFPTKTVVEGFGEISLDNKRIIIMEWIIEGVALVYLGVLVATVTLIDPSSIVSTAVYIVSVIGLIILATVSLFTGIKVDFLPFKLCPFIFTASAVLIMIGGLVLS